MPKVKPADYGTTEIGRRFTVVPVLSGPNTMNRRVIDEREIDRLLLDDRITPSEHAALEGLTGKLLHLGFGSLKSPSFEVSPSLDPSIIGDRKAKLIMGMVKIFAGLDEKIGPARRRALIDLCLLDAPWTGDDISEVIGCLGSVLRRED